MRTRISPIWNSAAAEIRPVLEWLNLRPKIVFWASGLSIALAFLVFSGTTAAGAALLGWAALRQAATASDRHQEQTKADQQRRITESFSKAAEQLASDKLELRLGGIYTLERISQESETDYWPVMETLTAFVRERTHRLEAERTSKSFGERVAVRAYFLWENAGKPDGRSEEFRAQAVESENEGERPLTDIDAVLTVIKRRDERSRERERTNNWCLNFRGAVLRNALLHGAHLEGANFLEAHLERARLTKAHLEKATLLEAHLERADLRDAHLEGAILVHANLKKALLKKAHLEQAILVGANLEGASLEGAGLGQAALFGANLKGAKGLSQAQLSTAFGDLSRSFRCED